MIRYRRLAAVAGIVAALVVQFAFAAAYDPPAEFYNAATGTGATLKSQLQTIMSTDHVLRTYGDFRFSAAVHDADPNVPGNILLVYNRASVVADWDVGVTWNREHLWPISLQPGSEPSNTTTGHRADPHVLRPCNPSINTSRGNKPFGWDDTTGDHRAVEDGYYFPGDADKGDIARAMFYSDTRWGSSLGLSLTDDVPSGFQMGDLSSYIAWHFLDPPDEFERRRNHTIYSEAENPNYYTNNRNAFIDRPEFVWSIYVNNANDSQITIEGATVLAGASQMTVDLGRVFVGDAVPAAQTFTLNKSGNDGTYFEVTTLGDATSSLTGRYNAFRTEQTDSKSIDVGLSTSTATAGLRSGSVTIDNLDVTTGGGAGRGANDGNDVFHVSLAVLEHSTPSFSLESIIDELVYDFGTLMVGSAMPSFEFDVFNFGPDPIYTSIMDFDSFMVTGDNVFTTDLAASAGSLTLAGTMGYTFTAMMSTAAVGIFSATYTLMFSDEDLPGALSESITLTLMGEIIGAALPGDYNGDGVVDAADYVVWRKTYGQSVPAFTGADGDGDGTIGDGDYDVWTGNFGAIAVGSASGSGATVPEPGMAVLMVWSLAGLVALGRKRRR